MSTAVFRYVVDCVWNVMAHTQKSHISSLQSNERVHLNRPGRQFCRLLAAEVCASAVVMLDTAFSEVVWRLQATDSFRQFSPLHFPSLRQRVPSHFNCTLQLSTPNTPTVSPQHKPPHYNTHNLFFLALTVCVSHIHICFVQPWNFLPVQLPVSYMC